MERGMGGADVKQGCERGGFRADYWDVVVSWLLRVGGGWSGRLGWRWDVKGRVVQGCGYWVEVLETRLG